MRTLGILTLVFLVGLIFGLLPPWVFFTLLIVVGIQTRS